MKRVALFVSLVLCPAYLFAQWPGSKVPDSLSFQGYLTDTGGDAVTNGNYNLLFKMYKGDDMVWEQNHLNVPVDSGRFNVILSGTVTYPLDTVAFNRPIDLGITINGETEIVPRTPLTAAAYALGMRGMHATYVENATWRSMNVIGGAPNNAILSGVGSTIAGGGGVHTAGAAHANTIVFGDFSTISGGRDNSISAHDAVIAGGKENQVTQWWGVIGGGHTNVAGESGATVAGGTNNSATGIESAVGGGTFQQASGWSAAIAGGSHNIASNGNATVGGGGYNKARGSNSVIAGGFGNEADGEYSTVPGGQYNAARGDYSLAAGFGARVNHDGTYVWNDRSLTGINDTLGSSAANQYIVRATGGVGLGTNKPKRGLTISRDAEEAAYQLELRNVGDIHGGMFDGISFTQQDSGDTEIASIKVVYHSNGKPDMSLSVRDAPDALFIESVTGDVGIGTTSPAYPLQVGTGGNTSNGNGAYVTTGGVWTDASSRTFKTNFEDVDSRAILDRLAALPIATWAYKDSDEGRHMGPVAEDFHQAFGLGDNERYISGTDARGVSMAAIQGLYKLVQEQQALIVNLTARLEELENR